MMETKAKDILVNLTTMRQEIDFLQLTSDVHAELESAGKHGEILLAKVKSCLEVYSSALELRFTDRSKKKYLFSALEDLNIALRTYKTANVGASSEAKFVVQLVLENVIDSVEDELERLNENKGTSEVKVSSSKKIKLNIGLSPFMLIIKELEKQGVFSLSEPEIGVFLQENFIQKSGKPITENSVTTMFSKTIGDRSYDQAKDILTNASDSI